MTEQNLRGTDGRLHYLGRPLPDGPWHSELDRVEIQRDGICCVIDRERMGSWAGFVALPANHPWVANDLDPTLESGPWHEAAHEGITFCSQSSPISQETDDSVIWIGFDCAHAIDLIPAYAHVRSLGTYRDCAYALREVFRLADAARLAMTVS